MSRIQQIREFAAEFLFGDVIAQRVQQAVRVEDDKFWNSVSAASSPNDLPWSARQSNLSDALEAWRINPLARQLVRLTRGFVLQDGVTWHAKQKRGQKFVDDFWFNPRSRMPARFGRWCDALVMFGEVYPVLFWNHADGMSYVRSLPAKSINDYASRPGDFESVLTWHQLTQDAAGLDWHTSESVVERWGNTDLLGMNRPEILHFAVNVPEGGLRGSGDLDPVLPWLSYYKTWLEGRWTINQAKGVFVWDLMIEGADNKLLRAKQRELAKATAQGGIYAHNEKETLQVLYPGISADSVEPDGRAFRMMIAAGGGTALHHLGENDSLTRASATGSDRGMLSHYATRQNDLLGFGAEMFDRAAWRAAQAGRVSYPRGGFKVEAEIGELTREDNLMLAQAAREIVTALTTAKSEGWVTDEVAIGMMLKFAGEVIDVPEMLAQLQGEASSESKKS